MYYVWYELKGREEDDKRSKIRDNAECRLESLEKVPIILHWLVLYVDNTVSTPSCAHFSKLNSKERAPGCPPAYSCSFLSCVPHFAAQHHK